MSHVLTRRLLLRLLGCVYIAAFLSLAWQVEGLLGPRGILPAAEYLDRAAQALGAAAPWRVPTVFWLDASSVSLELACLAGAVLAVLLVLGVAPLATALGAWLLYLSLVSVGQRFLAYQWDALLLETGFLAILWAPAVRRLGAGEREPSRLVLWLLRWLVFRLMFFSGWVKLASGDPTWWSLTALEVHYETQPLPAWTSWYAHQLPAVLHRVSCAVMFVIELVLPFLIPFGRRARLVAFAGFVLLQVAIAATGNYGFFNLLSAVLCVPLLDDGWLARVWPRRAVPRTPTPPQRPGRRYLDVAAVVVVLALTVPLSLAQLGLRGATSLPGVRTLLGTLAPLRIASTYGLFAVMTTTRREIVLEGTVDGRDWRPYVFRWKPGPLTRAPSFVAPHMPRLDWQLWFDALYVERMLATGRGGAEVVTPRLLSRLRDAEPSVLALLERDPFDGERPTALRWRLYDYRFTDPDERATTGRWWHRRLLAERTWP